MTNNSAFFGSEAFSRGHASELGAHQNAEIEPRDVDQVAFVNVLAPPQPRPAHAATVEHMGKAALHHFLHPAERLLDAFADALADRIAVVCGNQHGDFISRAGFGEQHGA